MKRSLLIEYNDNQPSKELEIGKAASIKTGNEFITIEKMKDGRWRLLFSESLIEDFSKVKGFSISRED
jgi:hypothetical protein